MRVSSPYFWCLWPKERAKHVFLSVSRLPEEHLKAIQDYVSTQLSLDAEFVKTGSSSLPHLRKLTVFLCKEVYG